MSMLWLHLDFTMKMTTFGMLISKAFVTKWPLVITDQTHLCESQDTILFIYESLIHYNPCKRKNFNNRFYQMINTLSNNIQGLLLITPDHAVTLYTENGFSSYWSTYKVVDHIGLGVVNILPTNSVTITNSR